MGKTTQAGEITKEIYKGGVGTRYERSYLYSTGRNKTKNELWNEAEKKMRENGQRNFARVLVFKRNKYERNVR